MFDRRDLPIALAVCLVALWANLAAVPTTRFHRDEARWTHRARFVEELRDPLSAYWSDRELMRGQPPLGSYLTGLGLLAQGRGLRVNDFYNFQFSEGWNLRHGAVPAEADLAAARRTNSVVGALLAAAVYLLGRGLLNRVAGIVGAALLVSHPLSLYLSSLAGSDALVSLLVAWAALAAMALAAKPTWPRSLLLGLLLGLGASTKLSPLLLAVPLAGLGLVLIWRGRSAADPDAGRRIVLGWRLLPLPLVAFATFVLSYPYLWPDPIGRTLALFAFRTQEMRNQARIWDELRVDGPVDALGRIGGWLTGVEPLTDLPAFWAAGRFGFESGLTTIGLLLGIVGAELLLVLLVRRGLSSPTALAAAVLGGQAAVIVVGMRADFERYLLPVLVATSVCGGLAVGQGWALARTLLTRRPALREQPEPAEPADAAAPELRGSTARV